MTQSIHLYITILLFIFVVVVMETGAGGGKYYNENLKFKIQVFILKSKFNLSDPELKQAIISLFFRNHLIQIFVWLLLLQTLLLPQLLLVFLWYDLWPLTYWPIVSIPADEQDAATTKKSSANGK